MQKPATQVNYDSVWRNHIGPHLGEMPLAVIDEDQLSLFRATLRQRLSATTANVVLGKVAKIFQFAKRMRQISTVPTVEKLSTPRSRPKEILSDEQIDALLGAARSLSPTSELICLLALDAGLRTSEICALEWSDVDLKEGSITVQHNSFRGKSQTPKGNIGKLALTSALRRALAEHRKREPIGPFVLYRRSPHTRMDWAPHTPHSIRYALGQADRKAGLRQSGPHLLRHTALTRLANLGASIYVVQAVARHSRLQTTQTYLHTQQVGLAREAADLLDRAATRSRGKAVAKRAKARV
jgi:integrase